MKKQNHCKQPPQVYFDMQIQVLHFHDDKKEIENALKKVKSQIFYKKIKNIKNPYGDGKSALKIIQIIKKLNLKNFNTQKKLTY